MLLNAIKCVISFPLENASFFFFLIVGLIP